MTVNHLNIRVLIRPVSGETLPGKAIPVSIGVERPA